jgi:hypothetical protein
MRKTYNKQVQVSFVMPPDEVADIEKIAKQGDTSVSWWVRQAVRRAIEEQKAA